MLPPRVRISGTQLDASEIRRMCSAAPTPADGTELEPAQWREIEVGGVVLGWLPVGDWEILRARLLELSEGGADVRFEERAQRRPSSPRSARAEPPVEPAVRSGVRSRPLRLLVVVLDAALRSELLASLASADAQGLGIDRGSRALALAARERPHAIVAQQELGDRTGAQLLRAVRSRWPEVRCVLVARDLPTHALPATADIDLRFGAPLDPARVARETLALCRADVARAQER